METSKIISISNEQLTFDNAKIYSNHDSDCCEHHWLSFEHLTMEDFEGLEFDLSADTWFKKIAGYGIELIPISGHSVRIPGYGENNGYYSTDLEIAVELNGETKTYDITECQVISGY